MVDDTCKCGRDIVQPATGRRRAKCETCSPRQVRGKITQLPVAPGADTGEGPLVTSVRATLRAAGRDGTAEGEAAVFAAKAAEAGGNTGASIAALLKEMRSSLDAALKGAQAAGDLVDELRAKRVTHRTG